MTRFAGLRDMLARDACDMRVARCSAASAAAAALRLSSTLFTHTYHMNIRYACEDNDIQTHTKFSSSSYRRACNEPRTSLHTRDMVPKVITFAHTHKTWYTPRFHTRIDQFLGKAVCAERHMTYDSCIVGCTTSAHPCMTAVISSDRL